MAPPVTTVGGKIKKLLGGHSGLVVWQGPSQLDGQPIVVLATSVKPKPRIHNGKTGDVVQTWILRADMSPVKAVRCGEDVSICGQCSHRAAPGRVRTCYPQLRMIEATWAAWRRGRYADIRTVETDKLAWILSHRPVRFGSYGDPAAAPPGLWAEWAELAPGALGYTHQWATVSRKFNRTMMASVESETERSRAKALGYRTFRVRAPHTPLLAGEIACPADEALGRRKTQCVRCRLCDGSRGQTDRRKDIAVTAHGVAWKSLGARLRVLNNDIGAQLEMV